MKAAVLSLTYHGSCAIFHTYAIYWLMFKIGLNILEMASFFTVWTTVFHLLMFLTLAAHDARRIFNDQTTKHRNSSSRNVDFALNNVEFLGIFIHLAIVMSSFTQFVFWLLFYIDREMILPETAGIPSSLNHMLHTLPLFLALVAVHLFAKNFPSTKDERHFQTVAQAGVKLVSFVALVYLIYTWILFEVKGVWPYPFMFSFSRIDYIMFSSCAFLFSLTLCCVCSFVEDKIKNISIL